MIYLNTSTKNHIVLLYANGAPILQHIVKANLFAHCPRFDSGVVKKADNYR
jgi:hypothetical protein